MTGRLISHRLKTGAPFSFVLWPYYTRVLQPAQPPSLRTISSPVSHDGSIHLPLPQAISPRIWRSRNNRVKSSSRYLLGYQPGERTETWEGERKKEEGLSGLSPQLAPELPRNPHHTQLDGKPSGVLEVNNKLFLMTFSYCTNSASNPPGHPSSLSPESPWGPCGLAFRKAWSSRSPVTSVLQILLLYALHTQPQLLH